MMKNFIFILFFRFAFCVYFIQDDFIHENGKSIKNIIVPPAVNQCSIDIYVFYFNETTKSN